MNALVERIGWTLLHSLWQGALAWAVLQPVLIALRHRTAQARYLAAGAALGFAVFAPAVTFFRFDLRDRLEAARVAHLTAQADSATRVSSAEVVHADTGAMETHSVGSKSISRGVNERLRVALPWLVLAWAIGCAGSWVRLAFAWRASVQLQRTTAAAAPAEWVAMLDRLCARSNWRRAVRLRLCDLVDGPAVVGWLKPVILIPAGALAGLSTLQIEALLAHELAHIRRHDFVVNLLQAVSEAVFYYHPAIHAINRQIRAFREQACDDEAVAATGDALSYARALAVLEGNRVPRFALAAARREGELLTRIKRLVGARVVTIDGVASVASATMLSVLAYFVLLIAAPAVTAQVITAQERIRSIRAAVPESWVERLPHVALPTGGVGVDEKEIRVGVSKYRGPTMQVEGGLVDEAGSPVNFDGDLMALLSRERYQMALSIHVRAGRFAQEIPAGELRFMAWPKGYAPLAAGPFLAAANTGSVSPITLCVHRGYSSRLRLVGDGGSALADVDLRGTLLERDAHGFHGGSTQPVLAMRTDANGEVLIEHIDDGTELTFQVTWHGYQDEQRVFRRLPSDAVTVWQLKKAQPAIGRVVDSVTSMPIAGASVLLAGRRSATANIVRDPRWDREVLAVTDAAGRFEIDTLSGECEYRVVIEADHYPWACERLQAGTATEFRLARGLSVSGMLTGVPPGNVTLDCEYRISMLDTRILTNAKTIVLAGDSSERSFAFDGLPSGYITLRARSRTLPIELQRDASDVVFDLAVPEAAVNPKTLTVTFAHPREAAPAVGNIEVWTTQRKAASSTRVARIAKIHDDRATVADVFPGEIEIRPVGMIGYWFPPQTMTISELGGPATVTLEVAPAGAIHGHALDAEGRPTANSVFVSCVAVKLASRDAISGWSERWDDAAPEPGRFTVTPLPIDGSYRVIVGSGCNFTVSEPIKISAEAPLATLELRQSRGVTLTGTVIDANGGSGGARNLSWVYCPTERSSYSANAASDADGNFTLSNVNLDVPGYYELRVVSDRYQTLAEVKVTANTPQPIVLRLKSGNAKEARLPSASLRP